MAVLLTGCTPLTIEDWRPRLEQDNGYIEVDADRDEIVIERVWRL